MNTNLNESDETNFPVEVLNHLSLFLESKDRNSLRLVNKAFYGQREEVTLSAVITSKTDMQAFLIDYI